jgi:hypothetical protein
VRSRLSFERGTDGELLRARARTSAGPLFDLDLTPIRAIRDRAHSDGRTASLTGGRFAIDTRARVVVVRGVYMSANSWFTGKETTSVLGF